MTNLPGLSKCDFLSRFLTEQKQPTFINFFSGAYPIPHLIDFQLFIVAYLDPNT
jgi:hypothetical protein